MKKKIIAVCGVLLGLLAMGCQDYGNKHYYHELEKIDHRHNRELARREIMALKSEIATYPEYIKMYHQLLIAELNDEVLPYRNLDVARKLVDYYEDTNDHDKLIRSYIIAGKIFANCSDGPKALSYYYKAEEMLDDQSQPELKNQLNANMANLLLHHNMPDQARVYATRSLSFCRSHRDTLGIIRALRYISESQQQVLGEHTQSLFEAVRLAKEAGFDKEQQELMIEIASSYCDSGEYRRALIDFLNPLEGHLPKEQRHQVDALLARIHYHLGHSDSAAIYGQRALETGNSISKRDAHEVLAHIAIERGHRASAEEHFTKYKELNDELNHIRNSEAIAQMDAFYHNQKQAEENARLRFDNSYKQNVIVIIIACLVVIVILFATYIQRHRRKQELMALRIQQLEEYRLSYENTDKATITQTKMSIHETPIYQRLATLEESEHPTDADWQSLADAIAQAYPKFSSRLFSFCTLSSHEYHVCLLLKAGFEPARIATLTLRSKAAVSTARSRLYEKAFGKKGSAKDWDEVIQTL